MLCTLYGSVGHMVFAFSSGLSGLDLSPGWGQYGVFSILARHFTPTVPLSTKVYKWVWANSMLRHSPVITCNPPRGKKKYPWSLHATEAGDKRLPYGLLGFTF